jgi:hypothetical protein
MGFCGDCIGPAGWWVRVAPPFYPPSFWARASQNEGGAKFAAYRSLASLRDFVLIESETAQVEVYSLEEGRWVVRFFLGVEAFARIPSIFISRDLQPRRFRRR